MEVKTTEFFKNMKTLPPVGSKEFKDLVDWEVEKCTGGVTVNGILIPAWLYFHTNHWWIRIDSKDKYNNITRIIQIADLRDNEWERAEALEQCKNEMKGYMEVGLRQGGKSEFEASITGWNALMFQNTQNVVVGGNGPDLIMLTDKLGFGLDRMWEGLHIPRIDKDWKKPMVRLGYKDTNNRDYIWSYIMIRNAADGINTEAPAGTTAKSFVMDEIGKYRFGQVFEAGKPAFLSEFGWRTVPVLVGTGGSFEKGEDAEKFFNNPDANNFLAFVDEKTGDRTCKFMSGLYRQDCKEWSNLADYLIKERGLVLEDISELSQIPIKVSNKALAKEKIDYERLVKSKDPDQMEYLKVVMYSPLTPKECFLTVQNNIYNVELCSLQRTRIKDLGEGGTAVTMEVGVEGNIYHKPSNKRPISNFPHSLKDRLDAPVVIYEFPVSNAPFGLYVAGVDPYRQGQAKYSESLGVVYIFKMIHDIQSEKFQYMIVASYAARPKNQDDWNEQARRLIKYYNARTLCENDEMSFINYMISKNDDRYLEKTPSFIRELTPHSSSLSRDYGMSRSAEAHRDFLNGLVKKYTEEVLHKEILDNGEESILYGVARIQDMVLLEELIKFNDKVGNFDRQVAFSLALAQAHHLMNYIKVATTEQDPRLAAYFAKKRVRNQMNSVGGESMRGYKKRIGKLFK